MRVLLQSIITVLIIALGYFAAQYIQQLEPAAGMQMQDAHGAGGMAGVDADKGPHGGKLLTQGGLQLEITLYEQGVPPEFHAYPYLNGKAINPGEVDLTITLLRLGGKTDNFSFVPRGDYLLGDQPVTEPHSFDVRVRANYLGSDYEWQYQQYEGRTRILEETAAAVGIEVGTAGPAQIKDTLTLQGRVEYDAQRLRKVMARFPGVVRMASKNIGDRVQAGEVLAQVESNDSLQTYGVHAPISGIVIEQQVAAGETVTDTPLYVIANTDRVRVDLAAFRRDLPRLQRGQSVEVFSLDGEARATGKIDYLAPVSTAASQSTAVRIHLDNPEGIWRPGMAIKGVVTIRILETPLAVHNDALQKFRDFDVVYARHGDIYEVRMLQLGMSDGNYTEVLGGLDPGTEYVVKNSYLIKADIEKSGASHDH